MNINVLGTGMVGKAFAERLSQLGYEVHMGTRNAEETKKRVDKDSGQSFADWLASQEKVKLHSYSDLPKTEITINAASGQATIEALKAVGEDKLNGTTLLDLANPLDFSKGMPPSLTICNTDSLGEEVQRTFPEVNVVKSLNTMSCYVMVDPSIVPGDHAVFVCGNNEDAKDDVMSLLKEFGWTDQNIADLGDITAARGTEMLLPIWLRLWGTLGTHEFNFGIIKK